MKTTYNLWIVGFVFILSMMGGCSSGGSEDIPTPTPPPVVEKDYITIQKDSLQATCQGGELTISFTTNKAWTASSSQAWCTLSTSSGEKGTASLKATVAENTAYNERSAIITIKAGTVSQKITITQKPAEKDKLELANTSFTVSAEGKNIQISFNTDVAWEATSDQEWCTLSNTTGEAGNQSITATITKNKEMKERLAKITFKAGTASPQTVSITQEAAEPDKLELATTSFTVSAEGKDIQISFNTDVTWEATSDQEWCTLSDTTGEAGNQSITATIKKNKELKERKATITFKAGTAIPQTVTITQEAAEPDKLELATTSFTVSAEGKEILIPFYTDVTWEAASNQEWCTLLATSGEAGNQSLTVKIAKNKEKKERQATVTFKAGTANPQTVTITQEAAPPDEIDLDKTSFEVGTDGKTIELTFTTNAPWMIASNQSWCTLSTANGDEGTHTLTVTIDKNTSYDDRTATITLKAGSALETVTITQEKKYHLKVSYKASVVDYAGGTVSMTVQCNTQYEVSIGGNWIKQTKNKSTRSLKEETVSFEIDINNADKGREADITFFNKERNLKETITIKQQAKPEDTSVKPSGNVGNMTWG